MGMLIAIPVLVLAIYFAHYIFAGEYYFAACQAVGIALAVLTCFLMYKFY